MLADPQSIGFGGTAYSFPRTGSGIQTAVYENSGYGDSKFTVSHTSAKRTRHVVRLDNQKIAADPLQPATNRPFSMSTYLVVDVPLFGYSEAEQGIVLTGLISWLAAGTNSAKVLGGES